MEDLQRDVDRHEKDIEKLWERKASKEDLLALEGRLDARMGEQIQDMRALRMVLIGFAITVATAALGITAAVLTAGGHP